MKLQEFTKGIIKYNAVFALALGLCPTLAITTSVENALGMSFAVAFVLISSNLIISGLRNFVPREVRIPSFIVIIASLVTIIDLFIHGYSLTLYKNLGIFLPLIVVNCIILGRAEAFASKRSVPDTLLDAAGISVGFAIAIISVSVIREFFGTGSIVIFGRDIVPAFTSSPATAMLFPPGAFLTIGILLALLRRAGVM
jgi:electron transport complex protein RnfE